MQEPFTWVLTFAAGDYKWCSNAGQIVYDYLCLSIRIATAIEKVRAAGVPLPTRRGGIRSPAAENRGIVGKDMDELETTVYLL